VSIVLWIAGAFLLVRLLPFFLTFLVLLRVTLQPTAYRCIEESEVDPELARFLRTIASPLPALGFEEVGFIRVRRVLRSSDDQTDMLELLHRASATFCAVGASETPDRLSSSLSFLTERSVPLLSLNGAGHGLIGDYPGVELFDPYRGKVEDAGRDHLVRLNGIPGTMVTLEQRLSNSEARDRRYLEALVESGRARPGREPNTFELTVKGALGAAKKMLGSRAQMRKMALERRAHAKDHPELYPEPPLSEEVKAYKRHEDVRRTPNRRQTLAAIFGATAILFTLSMLHLFDAAGLAVLIAVLFFHELGHYFAMRVFDYRDTTIFFIPFLGAAATGRKDRPSLAEEMMILLAGPVPGLLLGAALSFVPPVRDSELGRNAILMLVAVNLFNLLPIFPLDGGRIVHALLCAGRPVLDVAFKVLAVGCFVGMGLMVQETVVVMIALLVAISIPLAFRTSRMEAEFRAEEKFERPDDPIRWIFSRLRQSEKPTSFPQKLAIARQLEQRLAHEPARWWRTVPWLAAYSGCVAGGITAIAVGTFTKVFAPATLERAAIECPIDRRNLQPFDHGELTCDAPNEQRALELQEALVLAETGGPYCVPAPWESKPSPEQRRALLTLRIGQHAPAETLQSLIAERANDPEFDAETIRLLLAAQNEDPAPLRALSERLGGQHGDVCTFTRVYAVERDENSVSFLALGQVVDAADFLCKLGCTVSKR
jgi:Zn-dependent protease